MMLPYGKCVSQIQVNVTLLASGKCLAPSLNANDLF